MKLKLALKSAFRRWSVVAATLILVATGVLKWHASLMPENVRIPSPTMPSPNARDYYTAAESLLMDGAAIDNYMYQPTKPIGNDPDLKLSTWVPRDRPLTLMDADKLIAENAPAIAHCRQAMNYEYMAAPARSVTTLFPYFSKDRAMARLLEFKGRTRYQQGRWSDGMDADLDAMKIGADIPRGSVLLGLLVGMTCQGIGRRHLGDVIPHLTSAEAERGARRLEAIDNQQYPIAETLRQEQYNTQAIILELFRAKHGRSDWFYLYNGNLSSISLRVRLALESPREAYDNYSIYMRRTISRLRLPYPQQKLASPITLPQDPVCAIMIPEFAVANFHFLATVALNRLAEVQLALQAYRADQGEYPSSLAALTPRYIGSVPRDPFANNAALVYRRIGTTYVLYSIGPDAADNGGFPITNINVDAKMKYSVLHDPNALGDIVAGINR